MKREPAGKAALLRRLALVVALPLGLAACDIDDGLVDPDVDIDAPSGLDARYAWVLQGWRGTQPVGQPSVTLTWSLPARWSGEVFRVYSRRGSTGSFTRIATVTSCAEGRCRYSDVNVSAGTAYEYYVASADERSGHEVRSDTRVQVRVPSADVPQAPQAPRVVALDGANWLRWESTGAERYRVFVERMGSDSVFFEVGETDGLSFLDTRARNGITYAYRVAAVDTLGHLSARSALGSGTPRPDYHAELIYAHEDNATASAFRFPSAETETPVVAGSAGNAQWRLETVAGVLSIRPLGQTQVTRGRYTSALTCGPGSDPDCEAVAEAPASPAEFLNAPVPVEVGNTYVFRVVGDDGRTRFGKVRVQGRTVDASSRTVVVFDWAYQLRPDTRSLNRLPG